MKGMRGNRGAVESNGACEVLGKRVEKWSDA